MKKLTESPKHKQFRIVKIADDISIKALEVGITVGTKVKLIQKLPFNGGTLIEYGEFNLRLAVNSDDSGKIIVA